MNEILKSIPQGFVKDLEALSLLTAEELKELMLSTFDEQINILREDYLTIVEDRRYETDETLAVEPNGVVLSYLESLVLDSAELELDSLFEDDEEELRLRRSYVEDIPINVWELHLKLYRFFLLPEAFFLRYRLISEQIRVALGLRMQATNGFGGFMLDDALIMNVLFFDYIKVASRRAAPQPLVSILLLKLDMDSLEAMSGEIKSHLLSQKPYFSAMRRAWEVAGGF